MTRRSIRVLAREPRDQDIDRLLCEIESATRFAALASVTSNRLDRYNAIQNVRLAVVRAHELLFVVNLLPEHHEIVKSVLDPLAQWLRRELAESATPG